MAKLLSTILLSVVLLSGSAKAQQQDSASVKKDTVSVKKDSVDVKNTKKEKKIYLYGYLSDSFTRSHIPDVKVVLLKPDSTLVDSAQVFKDSWQGFTSTGWSLQVPAKPAKYIIKATHPDYETTYKNYEV